MHSLLVVGVDDLGVFDAEAAVRLTCREGVGVGTGGVQSGGESGNGESIRVVPDGVDVDLVAFRGPRCGEVGEGGGIDEEGAPGGRAVGVWFYEGAAVAA